MIVFGPVPSRRLGRSLGINHIKGKICTYDCIYCQEGRTACCSTERDCCLSPYELYSFVKKKVEELIEEKIHVDFMSFVPSGEPTLDNSLSKHILLLREFGYKIAVFTNSSLLWNDIVKENLLFADYVSVKIDTVNEETWEKINRPHRRLRFDSILDGITDFSKSYQGILTTESMLVKNVNDNLEEMAQIANFVKTMKRKASYFAIPIRPPSERYAVAPDADVLEGLSAFIKKEIPRSEMLCCPESGDFNATGNIEEELLAIMSVHPMREDSVKQLLEQRHKGWSIVLDLLTQEKIKETSYLNQKFYSQRSNN
jgi:wyosine [tRNA(Phe)-imidazoG37] synthetase (radical SAM superfamily)